MIDPILVAIRQTTQAAQPGWLPSKLQFRQHYIPDSQFCAGSDGRRDTAGITIIAGIALLSVFACIAIVIVSVPPT